MADNETREDHPETSASTPDSTAGDATNKAAKDRSCPFCGQAFTSSSLGRHLDLYIKPKNPKPPDGVHDVNEIRKLRGTITRRQPRTSTKAVGSRENAPRRNSSGWSSGAKLPAKGEARFVADESPVGPPVDAKEEGLHTWFNTPTWHATGVINDLPARAPSRSHTTEPTGQARRAAEMRRDGSGSRIERPPYVSDDVMKLQEAAEAGRAAEMALREVLGSLAAAKSKAEPRGLFPDFDFCSLSFPGLCLALLPPPPTLFSSTPFSSAHTWSLSAPGEKQYDALKRYVNENIAAVRNGKIENLPDSVAFRYFVHLQGSYEHWETMSVCDKDAAWNLELSRSFVRERERSNNLKAELESAQQHIKHLEAEYERMSRCQLPREYLLHPPNTLPVSSATMREMKTTERSSGGWEADYDADVLIHKWKATVKATTRPQKLASSTDVQPPYQYNAHIESRRNPLKADMMMNGAVFGVNGPMPRDFDMHKENPEQARITYETPQHPGAIISADDDGTSQADADGDADAEMEDARSRTFGNEGALTRTRMSDRFQGELANGAVNRNGKRPLDLAWGAANGKAGGPKVYRAQAKS